MNTSCGQSVKHYFYYRYFTVKRKNINYRCRRLTPFTWKYQTET